MPGEIVVLVGPSGCGKSTTLKMINRLIEPTSGRIFLEGRDVTAEDPVQLRRRIGYVIQQIGLFPHQKIATNVATVPSLIGTPRAEARERARELLALVGLDPDVYADRYPHQLSGGQQQRVGVARALAADPPVLLMDEPFAAVDPVVRGPPAGRVPPAPGRARQDRRTGHPRHRRGREDGRQGRGARGGRSARAVRDAGRAARPPGRRLRRRLRGLDGRATAADRHQAGPGAPRAAGRRRHRRPRRRHRPGLHPRARAGGAAARRPAAGRGQGRARSSSASSPPTASTGPSGPRSTPAGELANSSGDAGGRELGSGPRARD